MKENFQIHIWLGLLLCLLGMSCSDDTPAKGNEPGNGNTELEVNEWIESVMRSDYLWNNDIPAQNKLDFSADPQTFFRSMLSLKDGKTRNGKHLYYYSYMEKNKDYKARTSIDADDTYGMEFTLFNVVNDSNQPLGYYYARVFCMFFLIVRHQVQVWKEGIGSWVLKEKIILIPIIMESY